MEKEIDRKLPFLDVLVTRKVDGSLGHSVYRIPTHTDRYLNKNSNHHPGQKRAMMKTLINRATRICEPHLLQAELRHLDRALQANGFTSQEVKRALHPRNSEQPSRAMQPPATGTVILPYINKVTDRIGKLFRRHNVKTVFKPTHQLRNLLRSAKDTREPLSSAGVYRIPCSCGAVYIGTTKRSINTRIQEHKRSCRLMKPERSAVAEHVLAESSHSINYNETTVLSTTTHYYTRLHREAIEIHKHPNNFNKKEEGLRINKIWYPALKKTERKNPSTRGQSPVNNSITTTSGIPNASQSGTSIPSLPTPPTSINMSAQPTLHSVAAETSRYNLRARSQRLH